MKFKFTTVLLAFTILLSATVHSQNIFDTTTVGYYAPNFDTQHVYVPTKFEMYIKGEVSEKLRQSNKVILANLTSGFIPEFTDTPDVKAIRSKYILLSYSDKKEWIATGYLEFAELNLDSSTFFKSAPLKIPENTQLFALRNNWDSLKNDWYLPFVSEVKLNGKKGYFPSHATDMGYVYLYTIDTSSVAYHSIYENDLKKEWDFPGIHEKNVNFDYNYSQPTYAAIIYLMTLFDSKTFFPGFKSR